MTGATDGGDFALGKLECQQRTLFKNAICSALLVEEVSWLYGEQNGTKNSSRSTLGFRVNNAHLFQSFLYVGRANRCTVLHRDKGGLELACRINSAGLQRAVRRETEFSFLQAIAQSKVTKGPPPAC